MERLGSGCCGDRTSEVVAGAEGWGMLAMGPQVGAAACAASVKVPSHPGH